MKRLVVLLSCMALLGLGAAPAALAETYDRVAQEEPRTTTARTTAGSASPASPASPGSLAAAATIAGRESTARDA